MRAVFDRSLLLLCPEKQASQSVVVRPGNEVCVVRLGGKWEARSSHLRKRTFAYICPSSVAKRGSCCS